MTAPKLAVMYSPSFRDHCCIKYFRFWLMAVFLTLFVILCALMLPKIFERRHPMSRAAFAARVQQQQQQHQHAGQPKPEDHKLRDLPPAIVENDKNEGDEPEYEDDKQDEDNAAAGNKPENPFDDQEKKEDDYEPEGDKKDEDKLDDAADDEEQKKENDEKPNDDENDNDKGPADEEEQNKENDEIPNDDENDNDKAPAYEEEQNKENDEMQNDNDDPNERDDKEEPEEAGKQNDPVAEDDYKPEDKKEDDDDEEAAKETEPKAVGKQLKKDEGVDETKELDEDKNRDENDDRQNEDGTNDDDEERKKAAEKVLYEDDAADEQKKKTKKDKEVKVDDDENKPQEEQANDDDVKAADEGKVEEQEEEVPPQDDQNQQDQEAEVEPEPEAEEPKLDEVKEENVEDGDKEKAAAVVPPAAPMQVKPPRDIEIPKPFSLLKKTDTVDKIAAKVQAEAEAEEPKYPANAVQEAAVQTNEKFQRPAVAIGNAGLAKRQPSIGAEERVAQAENVAAAGAQRHLANNNQQLVDVKPRVEVPAPAVEEVEQQAKERVELPPARAQRPSALMNKEDDPLQQQQQQQFVKSPVAVQPRNTENDAAAAAEGVQPKKHSVEKPKKSVDVKSRLGAKLEAVKDQLERGEQVDIKADHELKDTVKYFSRKLDAPQRSELVNTMRICQEVLKKASMTYFLHGRSLLGYYRHGGSIIPWDDQIELALLPTRPAIYSSVADFYERLKKVVEENFEGFALEKGEGRSLIFRKTDEPDSTGWVPTVRIMILDVVSGKNGKPLLNFMTEHPKPGEAIVKVEGPRATEYDLEEVLPVHPSTFEVVEVNVPSNIKAILDKAFHDLTICETDVSDTKLPDHEITVSVDCAELAQIYKITNVLAGQPSQ